MMFRWFALVTLIGCLSISMFYRHRARREGGTISRSREKPLFVFARIAFALPLFGSIIVYLVNPQWMAWGSFAAPVWVRWAGVGLGLLAVPAIYWVFSSIGKNVSETVLTKERHELVTHGPYRWVRHPLYTAAIVMVLAIGLMAASWFIILFALLVLVPIRLIVIPAEEGALVTMFGDEYRTYMKRTGRLLPRVR